MTMRVLTSAWVAPCVSLGVVTLSLMTASASAQSAPEDMKKSEELFQAGRVLWKDGNKLEACAKFRESYQAGPSIGNLLNLGRCDQVQEKWASAHKHFTEAAALAESTGDDKRAAPARKFADEAASKASKITVVLPTPAPADLAVRINGRKIESEQLSSPILFDPGDYTVAASAASFKAFETVVSLGDKADHKTVTIELQPIAPAPVPVPVVVPPPLPPPHLPPPPLPPPVTTSDDGGLNGLQIAGIVTGGFGVAGLLVGTIAGVASLSGATDLENKCQPNPDVSGNFFCDDAALGDKSSLSTTATLSTIGFIAGGALLAGGIVLVAVGSMDDSQEVVRLLPMLGPDGGGALFTGRF